MIEPRPIYAVLGMLLSGLLIPVQVQAHPGRTDASGCHTNRSTGEYHCHNSGTAPTTSTPDSGLPVIVSVGDGDTVRVSSRGKVITVRLGCTDAPEMAQNPWGEKSSNRLKQLLPVGQAVQIREIERDRYGRLVGELFLGNQSVNLQMVKEGQSVIYRQFLNKCSETKEQYLKAEAEAKQKRLGFWNQANPVMPWDFRRKR